jgi:hypothetical protein
MTLILLALLLAKIPFAVRFEPATKVMVTIQGSDAVERYFVHLDEDALTVLNLNAPGLPTRHLLGMAAERPEWMAATWKTIYKDGSLQVGPDGVFVKNRKLANLAQVVERIPRARIVSLKGS